MNIETLQLLIFSVVTLLSTRGVIDEVTYMIRPAPKKSQFTDRTHVFCWVGMATSLFFVVNGMSYFAV